MSAVGARRKHGRQIGEKGIAPAPSLVAAALRAAAKAMGVPFPRVVSPSRERGPAYARFVAIAMLHADGRYSLPGIGQRFGLDHTTVLHALQYTWKGALDGQIALARALFRLSPKDPNDEEFTLRLARYQREAALAGAL